METLVIKRHFSHASSHARGSTRLSGQAGRVQADLLQWAIWMRHRGALGLKVARVSREKLVKTGLKGIDELVRNDTCPLKSYVNIKTVLIFIDAEGLWSGVFQPHKWTLINILVLILEWAQLLTGEASLYTKNTCRPTQIEHWHHPDASWTCLKAVFVCFCTACCSSNPEHLFSRRWCGWVDGTPHGEGLPSLSLSAHLTVAAAALPKARPQAWASCGPPAGFTGIPKPIKAPLLSPPPWRPPPSPAALCPKMPLLSIWLRSAVK